MLTLDSFPGSEAHAQQHENKATLLTFNNYIYLMVVFAVAVSLRV